MTALLLFAFATHAQISQSAFDAANKLYEQNKFSEAASAYEKLLQNGQASEALYFNWGNSLFKSGQIGRAIAAYRQAERLSPRDADVRANLQFARNQVQGPSLLPDRLSNWLAKLSLNEWAGLASAALWTWLLFLTAAQWRPSLKMTLRTPAVWAGIATLILCALLGMALYSERGISRGIVIAQETTVRQAPLEESQSAFTLHDGAEVQILDRKDQWLQVQTDPRRTGWVRRENLLLKSG
jgi:tetratricopeptide (TPR) repeat protein